MEVATGAIPAADGIELMTRRWTPEDARRDLLIVHGVGEHSGRWGHVAEFFVERAYEVTAFDLRGHGESGGARVHVDSFGQLVDDLAAVAADVGRERPWVLYGHSFGGLIGCRYLASDHRQPDAAVLSAPGLDDEIPGVLHAASQVLGRLTPTLSIPNTISGEQLSRDPAVGEAYFADPLVETKATCRFGLESFSAQDDAQASIHDITVPTFVIHGAEDPLVPPHASAPLAAVDGVDRKLYPGLRHEIHNEPEQDQVLGDVADWLDATLA